MSIASIGDGACSICLGTFEASDKIVNAHEELQIKEVPDGARKHLFHKKCLDDHVYTREQYKDNRVFVNHVTTTRTIYRIDTPFCHILLPCRVPILKYTYVDKVTLDRSKIPQFPRCPECAQKKENSSLEEVGLLKGVKGVELELLKDKASECPDWLKRKLPKETIKWIINPIWYGVASFAIGVLLSCKYLF